MLTVLAPADAVVVVVVPHALFLEVGLMVALLAGVLHHGALAVGTFNKAVVVVVVRTLLEETAVVAIYHVVVFIHGNLLLTEVLVVGLLDIVANQTTLGVVLPVGNKGGPLMVVVDYLSAIQTLLVVGLGALQTVRFGQLHPFVLVVNLQKIVRLFMGYSALVALTIADMPVDVAGRSAVGNLLLELRLMGMPAKDEVAPATG